MYIYRKKYFNHTFAALWMLVLAAGVALTPASALAQKADASLLPEKIPLAGHATLDFRLEIPKNSILLEPFLKDTITGKIQIIGIGSLDTLASEGNNIVLSRKVRVTAYEGGFFPVPPIRFAYMKGADTLWLETPALLLEVESVEIDQEAPIRDVKEIVKAPWLLEDFLPWILLVWGFFLITGLAFYIYQRRRKNLPLFAFKPKPQIPPHVIAINELEHLRKKKLWQQGFVKVYHTGLTDIVRTYIEQQFQVASMEMTTDETLEALREHINEAALLHDLEAILRLADLAKFAKHLPEARENDLSLDLALKFVKETIPVPAEVADKIKEAQQTQEQEEEEEEDKE